MVAVDESNLDRALHIMLGLFMLLVTMLLLGRWQWVFGVAIQSYC